MKTLLKLATLLGFSVLFALVVLPLSVLVRFVFDPLRLRRNNRAPSYFRMHAMRAASVVRTGADQFAPHNS